MRWVGAAIPAAMLLGLGATAHAKECARATPLPADATITPPAAGVSADLARFSGAWGGVWIDRAGVAGLCSTLVGEDVFANGYVRVIDSVGVSDPDILQPRSWRASGRIVDGRLRFAIAGSPGGWPWVPVRCGPSLAPNHGPEARDAGASYN